MLLVLVEGLTDISKLPDVISKETEAQAENFSKMMLAMSDDVRVLYESSLADRLHNMRTINCLPDDKSSL